MKNNNVWRLNMDKKTSLIIILAIIILISIGFIFYSNQKNQVEIDGDTFNLPNGYFKGDLNPLGDVNITNGTNSIFICKYPDDKINKYINQYKIDVENNNQSIKLSNFTVDNLNVCKSENTNNGANHYWFIKDKHVYTIYSWDVCPNMDRIVSDLISSMNDNKVV